MLGIIKNRVSAFFRLRSCRSALHCRASILHRSLNETRRFTAFQFHSAEINKHKTHEPLINNPAGARRSNSSRASFPTPSSLTAHINETVKVQLQVRYKFSRRELSVNVIIFINSPVAYYRSIQVYGIAVFMRSPQSNVHNESLRGITFLRANVVPRELCSAVSFADSVSPNYVSSRNPVFESGLLEHEGSPRRVSFWGSTLL